MTAARGVPGPSAELDALIDLAQREHAAGRLAEAAANYQKILALRPDIAEVYHNLGNVLLHQGKLDEAAIQYEQALARNPRLHASHNELGYVLQQQGKLEQALARFEQAVAIDPSYPEALNNLGNVLKEMGKLDQAAIQYRRVLTLKPAFFQAHYNLGNVFQQQGRLEQALASLEQAVAIRPRYAEALNSLGNVLLSLGKVEEAAARYRQVLALQPDLAEAHHNLGDTLAQQGKLDLAASSYVQALKLKPVHVESYHGLAALKTFRPGDADLASLETLAADLDRLPPVKRHFVHFALGKALEDVGDYRRAFEHLLQGNALKRRDVDYDEAAHQRTFRLIRELCDKDLLNRFAGAGDPSPVPIFVLGMPRSGSTLVEQILASHPQIHAAGELANLNHAIETVCAAGGRAIPFPSCLRALDAEKVQQIGQAYLASLPPLPAGKSAITDKLPGNFLRLGLIPLFLPGARIIHTQRDPADTCVSCFSKLFRSGHGYSYELGELGRYYRGYHELMEHWRSVLPAGAMLDVSYEAVVDNLEAEARRLIEFCGLPWDDRCLRFHETSRPIATASNTQVRRPLYRSSLARWRRYEAQIQPLLAELEGLRPEA